MVSQLGGKELSFNNILDLDQARSLLDEFQIPACVIVKHGNPCGSSVATGALEAYQRAFACDPMSAFGGIVCLNRRVDKALAEALVDQFIEVLFAPGYDEGALEVLSTKPNMRILDNGERRAAQTLEADLRQVQGGLLVQDRDSGLEDRDEMQVASERRPTEAEWNEALFVWRVCKHVRSNAIVLSRDLATVGVGAGQMSRVDSVRLALEKAQAAGHSVEGAALASDAYFPFSDGPQLALDAGVSVIIQPGGSVRDEQTIEAVNAAGASMIFTSRRHFKH
jgi:phosphoribosylaminoimidazolecarboxamide formyltransferase/IMP cyclohydrolase